MTTNITLVATNATQMQEAQASLLSWIDERLESAERDLRALQENFDIAAKNGWRLPALRVQLNKASKLYSYYQKMREAVLAGYTIIPNLPVDVFAIRVQRDSPLAKHTYSDWGGLEQPSQSLPAGEGRYVDSDPVVLRETWKEPNGKGGEVTKVHRWADEFRDVAFPVAMIKPQIMEATAQAMAMKVFDEIGIYPARRSKADPMIVGQIKKPDGRRCAFLIAWWLDTAVL